MKTTSTPTPILRRLLLCVLLLLGAGSSQSAVGIYTNGPIVTNPGQGHEGADVSLATAALNNQTGFLMNKVSNYRLADDFSVPVDQKWNLTAVRFYGYENNSGTTPTINGLYARIWDGRPGDPGANVIWGNETANILASASFAGIYRVRDTESITNNTRPVMTLNGDVSTNLLAGTYWLEWMTTGSLSTPTGGPWDPPVSIVGQLTTGNARRFIPGTGWADARIGTYSQGFPFELEGTVEIVPEPGQWAMMGVTLLGAAGVVLRRYRRS